MNKPTFFIAAIMMAVAFLSGCYTNKFIETPPPKKLTERVFHASADSTWGAVMKVMATFPLTVIERESGILNTDWTTRTAHKKASVWRGLLFGGQVEEDVPTEVMERFNVLAIRTSDSTTTVKVIRYVKAREYNMEPGPKGSWSAASNRDFTQRESSTIPEWRLLNAIEKCLATGEVAIGDFDHAEQP